MQRNEHIAKGHVCQDIGSVPCDLFHQKGSKKGAKIVLVGESPAANGWHGGKACRTVNGTVLASGKRLNELLEPFGLTVDECGFTELAKCCVSDRKDLKQCSQKGWPLFLEVLKQRRYRLIVLLGVNTTQLAATLMNIPLRVGELQQVTIGKRKYGLLSIYHPSPINPHGRARNREIVQRERTRIEELLS